MFGGGEGEAETALRNVKRDTGEGRSAAHDAKQSENSAHLEGEGDDENEAKRAGTQKDEEVEGEGDEGGESQVAKKSIEARTTREEES